jgi:hypothetical protein
MTWLSGLPAIARFLIWVLIIVVVIIVLALVIHALGGFDLHLSIGHFFFQLGVT